MFYSFFNSLVKGYLKYRFSRVETMYQQPLQVQQEVFDHLLWPLKNTKYGAQNGANKIKTIDDFKQSVPLISYEDIYPFIMKMIDGEENILWPGKVTSFAKSSGTTNDKSKFIPITEANIFDNHVAASWDAMAILYKNRPDAKIFDKKNLIMGGSLTYESGSIIKGDVSAILLDRMPAVGRPFYSPDFETALLADWEEKIDKMAHQCTKEDIV
jgi:GH3 auxin-responsive promoter